MGFGMCVDSRDPRKAGGDALQRASSVALDRAELRLSDIDLVSHTGIGKSKGFSLVDRIGLAEASLPLFELAYSLANEPAGSNIMATSYSQEGFAHALILNKL